MKQTSRQKLRGTAKKLSLFLGVMALIGLAGCQTTPEKDSNASSSPSTEVSQTVSSDHSSTETTATSTTESTTASPSDEIIKAKAEALNLDLATKDYSGGEQTIELNDNVPLFTSAELDTSKGAWEHYGDLDQLNRATEADALLNQSLMPTEKRGDISSVTPTGWHNKEIKGGYLYNRSHLIGFALSGENANWKNLITGTRQLNSPGMLLYEMDIKSYLEQSPEHYVRYRVTPIFRAEELLARGVHLEAQSVGDEQISFNVYIFNVQEGVTLNYADGTSVVAPEYAKSDSSTTKSSDSQAETDTSAATATDPDVEKVVYITRSGEKYHSHAHGPGDFTKSNLALAKSLGLKPCKVCYGQ